MKKGETGRRCCLLAPTHDYAYYDGESKGKRDGFRGGSAWSGGDSGGIAVAVEVDTGEAVAVRQVAKERVGAVGTVSIAAGTGGGDVKPCAEKVHCCTVEKANRVSADFATANGDRAIVLNENIGDTAAGNNGCPAERREKAINIAALNQHRRERLCINLADRATLDNKSGVPTCDKLCDCAAGNGGRAAPKTVAAPDCDHTATDINVAACVIGVGDVATLDVGPATARANHIKNGAAGNRGHAAIKTVQLPGERPAANGAGATAIGIECFDKAAAHGHMAIVVVAKPIESAIRDSGHAGIKAGQTRGLTTRDIDCIAAKNIDTIVWRGVCRTNGVIATVKIDVRAIGNRQSKRAGKRVEIGGVIFTDEHIIYRNVGVYRRAPGDK